MKIGLPDQNRPYRPVFVIAWGIFFLFVTVSLFSTSASATPLLKIAWLNGTETISGPNINQSSGAALKWSSSSFDDGYFDHSLDTIPERLVIKNAGDYLIAITVPMSGSVTRAAVRTEVRVNGTPVESAIGESSYIRNSSGHNESSDHLAVLLTNLAVDDYVEVYVRQSAASGTINISGQASLYAEYIAPDRIVFSATAIQTTDSANLNLTTAYSLQWTEGRKDTGFTHSDSTDPENIVIDEAGAYLAFVNIPLSGFTTRGNVKLIIQDDGVTVAGGEGKQGYIRNASGHNESSIHWSGLISNVEAGSVITIQTQQEGAAGNLTVPAGKTGSLYLEKVDSSKKIYFARGNELTGGTNWNPVSAQSTAWINDDILDSNLFTHSTDTNPHQITVKKPGDYLLVYNDSLTSTGTRPNVKITVEVNGTPLPGAETQSHYVRSASGHNESSGSLVYLLRELAVDDVVTVSAVREAGASTVNDDQDALLLLWFKGDAVAPVLASAEVSSKSLVLNYTEINGLDTESIPETTDFRIGTDGATQLVTGVVVDANTVTLTLSPGVANADTITVSYTAGTDPIQDVVANPAADLVDQEVTNNTAKLVFVTQPGDGSVNSALTPQPIVEIQDAGGNPITTDPDDGTTETISLVFTAGTNEESAGLSGSATSSIDWSTGRATFADLSVNLMGSYQLNASTNSVSSTADSNAFSVTAGAPAQLAYGVEPTNAVSTASISPAIKVQVLDSFGNLVTTATDSITIAINDNPAGGTLSGTLTIAANNGEATFNNLSIDKAGAYSLDATALGLNTVTTASFDITVGTATQLVFSVQPIDTSSSETVSPAVKVEIQDAGGNLVPSVTDSITLAINSNPGSGVVSGTVTVPAAGGEATFSDISIDKAGSGYTLDATASSLSTATSDSFDISVGAATQLVYSVEPSNAVSSQWISPALKVQVLDQGGNRVNTATTSVTLEIKDNPGNGTLSGSLTVSAVAGEAIFSDASIDKKGNGYSLTVAASGLTSAVSDKFNIVASDEAIQLAFSVEPGDSVSQAILTPAIKVQVLDAGGNLIETATDPVTLTIDNNPGNGTLSGTMTVSAVNGEATFSDISLEKAGDGYTLIASASGLNSVTSESFRILTAEGTQLAFDSQPGDGVSQTAIPPAIKVQVRDSAGNLVATSNETITLAIGNNPGNGTLSGTLTVLVEGGEATFDDISIDKAGANYTLIASAPGMSSATSDGFSINLGAATQLSFSVQPMSAESGTAISPAVKVQVQDAGGNLVTTATNSIILQVNNNPGQGTLSGTLNVAAQGGEATFADISIDKAASGYSLLASAEGLKSMSSVEFDITGEDEPVGSDGPPVVVSMGAPDLNLVVESSEDPSTEAETLEEVQNQEADGIFRRVNDSITAPVTNVPTASPAASEVNVIREDSRQGLLNRESVLAGKSVTIRYRADSGLSPKVDVFDARRVRQISADPMREIGDTGIYEYNLVLEPGWGVGDFTIIASESGKGTLNWMTLTVVETKGADVTLVKTDAITVPALLAAVQTKLESVQTNLKDVGGDSSGSQKTAPEGADLDLESLELQRIQSTIRDISKLLKPVSNENGINLDHFYRSIDEPTGNVDELREKTEKLRILLELNRELTDQGREGTSDPVTKTWFESGSVILKILVVNPSKTESQTIPVKVYLPKEATPEDILDIEDLKLDYDSEKGMYYAHDEVELGPGQSITKMVRMEDIWVIPEEQLLAHVSQAKEIARELGATPFAEEGAAFLLAIESKVQEILETQEKTVSNAAAHIQAYRQATTLIFSIKNDLSALDQYRQRAVEIHSESESAMVEGSQRKVEVAKETPSEDRGNEEYESE